VAVTAACALFRRAPFEEAGGFDHAFKNGFEDVDLCLRLGEQGYEIHYCHESSAYHLEMGTRDFRDELPNLELYRRRWAHKLQPDAIPRYLEDGLLRIRYNVRYPFSLYVSPRLGLMEDEKREREADSLLASRADQVAELQRENIELRLLLGDAGIEAPSTLLSPPRAEKPQTARAALFVSNAYGDSMRFRCDHHVEELELLGASADAHWLHHVRLDDMIEAYSCFVLHRVPMDEHVDAFVKKVHQHGKVVIYDTDDLVFEPPDPARIADRTAAIEGVGSAEDHLHQAATMSAADAVFVSTEPLAEVARSFNTNVFVIPNAASREMIELGDQAEETAERQGENTIQLGYVSGSPTDALDFLEASDAVLWALETNPSVRLVLIGELDLGRRFDCYDGRIERIPVQPWRRLPPLLADLDVNLAPYEPGNPFSESKSCLKWLEAALVGTPTIASPRPDLVRAIKSGSDGLLAETPDEWRDALGELIGSRERRLRIGREAYAKAHRLHSTQARPPLLYEALTRIAGATVRDRKLTINWLIGRENGGRARKLARVAGELGWRGHRIRLFADSLPKTVRASVDFRGPASGPLPPADLAIASDSETATHVARDSNALFRLYLPSETDPRPKFDDLPLRRLPLAEVSTLEAEGFERVLLELCFARLEPMSQDASGW
jgi:glycosyltransferase involved in cell wall biosynthesis